MVPGAWRPSRPSASPTVPTPRSIAGPPPRTDRGPAAAALGAGGPPPEMAGRVAPSIEGYGVRGELGRGGRGVVYRARQVRLNRPCVLKMILAGAHAGAEATVRFLAE